MNERVLIVGGAGYIGSHTAMALIAAGHDVLVLDNLSTGHAEFLRFGRHVIGDLADRAALDVLFSSNAISTVMHFAALTYVGESVTDPAKYYCSNILNSFNLLEAARAHSVARFIFSSSCAIYGTPQRLPLTEDQPQNPINPYGRTKLAVEWMLRDFSEAYGMQYCALRYFNAAGAAPARLDAGIGERHKPETHLIPLILQAAGNPQKEIQIFGTDYETKDGTCIRDYIHVCDLAEAHVLAMERLAAGEESGAYNLGNGAGYSVKEIIECAQKVTGLPVRVSEAPRRAGDLPVLVGDAKKATTELGWKPNYTDLEVIVRTAWEWEKSERLASR